MSSEQRVKPYKVGRRDCRPLLFWFVGVENRALIRGRGSRERRLRRVNQLERTALLSVEVERTTRFRIREFPTQAKTGLEWATRLFTLAS